MNSHWLYQDLLKIPSISPSTTKTYWYVLRKGLKDDVLDAETMRENIDSDSQPSRVQMMLATYLKHREDLATPELTALTTGFKVHKDVKRKTKPTMPSHMLMKMFRQAGRSHTYEGFVVWTVLHLALKGYPLRVGELASIAIDDPGSLNWLDTKTDILTLRKHKTKAKIGTRTYQLNKGFSRLWRKHALRVFKTTPDTLIPTRNKYPFIANSLTKYLTKLGISSQALRPLITTMTLTYRGTTYKDRQILAHKMGHTLGTQATRYFDGHMVR